MHQQSLERDFWYCLVILDILRTCGSGAKGRAVFANNQKAMVTVRDKKLDEPLARKHR